MRRGGGPLPHGSRRRRQGSGRRPRARARRAIGEGGDLPAAGPASDAAGRPRSPAAREPSAHDPSPGATAFDPHVGLAWVERIGAGRRERVRDDLAVEEPLEIRVDGEPLAVTMRTPGEDEELAAGFLAGEGLIAGRDDVAAVGPTDDLAANIVEVRTRRGMRRDPSGERRFYLTSSCGVCGKGALDFVRSAAPATDAPSEAPALSPEAVLAAPRSARRKQHAFARTGGLHATALFAADGAPVAVCEDVGRHNAMDKVLGALLLDGRYPVRSEGLWACLSGRASFELVQKASMAGLLGLVAVGAPSTLAVALARERGLLLCGFVRGESFNVYAGAERLMA